MLEVMYELPAKGNIKKCVVSKDTILTGKIPTMIALDPEAASAKAAEKAASDKKVEIA
jgi:ATP-dependent protease Clp ATPase subunit